MKFRVERTYVLQQLAWETFVVGAHAGTSEERMAVLRTLSQLIVAEASRSPSRINDGNSARALLPRLIGATRDVRSSYLDEAYELAEEVLSQLEAGEPPAVALGEAIVGVLLSVRVEDSWTEGYQFHWGIRIVRPESQRGRWIVTTCGRLWQIARDCSRPTEARRTALALLRKHHQDLNYTDLHARREGQASPDWSFLIRVHLEQARALASQATVEITLWFAARAIWEWHAKFDGNAELKVLAEECETLFRADPMRGGYAALLLDDDDKDAAIVAAALQLRTLTASSIAEFFRGAMEFLAGDTKGWRARTLENVAWASAESLAPSEGMRGYWSAAFADSLAVQVPFATQMLAASLQRLRKDGSDEELVREVRQALLAAVDERRQREILLGAYRYTRIIAIQSIRPAECDLIVECLALFDTQDQLQFLGCIFALDSSKCRSPAERIFDEVASSNPFELVNALKNFCCGFQPFAFGKRDSKLFQQSDLEWFLEQLARLPEPVPFSALGDQEDMFEPDAKFPISWLERLIFKRLEHLRPLLRRERDEYRRDEAVWVLTNDFPFAELVAPLAVDNEVCAEERASIERLLDLRQEEQSVSYFLPSVLATLDPQGVLLPELVCDRIRGLVRPSWKELAVWADFASAYPFDSASWSRIARAVCLIANRFDPKDAGRAYSHLALHNEGAWHARPGTVPERFTNNVERAKKRLADEPDGVMRPFREWCLMCAESDLRYQQGRVEEEYGRTLETGDQ